MTRVDLVQGLAAATASLVSEGDLHQTLVRLVISSRAVLGADAAGVMVLAEGGELELLASSSHTAEEIELFQIQDDEGPCVDTVRRGLSVSVEGHEFDAHWPVVGPHIARAGYRVAQAYPLRWHGKVLGGLNAFWRSDLDERADAALGQVFADLLALLVMRTLGEGEEESARRVGAAVAGRAVIEQAKGVLAHRHHLDMATAFERLVDDAQRGRLSLSEAAEAVVRRAQTDDRADDQPGTEAGG